MRIGVVSVMRDEGDHLEEWLAFHEAIGVEQFWICDHNSKDQTRDILRRWAGRNVTFTTVEWDGKRALQLQCLDAASEWMSTCEWCGFLDGDELMVPLAGWSLPEVLACVPTSYDGVAFNWLMFGERDVAGTSLLSITRCASAEFSRNLGFKSFVRGKALGKCMWSTVHRPPIPEDRMCHDCVAVLSADDSRTKQVSYVYGRINHYKWRSEQELRALTNRGEQGYRRHPRKTPSLAWWRQWTNEERDLRAQEVAQYHKVRYC